MEIRIHLTFLFLLIFLLLIEVNRAGPRVVPRVLSLPGSFWFQLLLHELGHAVVSARQGFPVKGSVLLPIGGLAMGDPTVQGESARDLRRETLIALAGPLVNAVLAGAAALVLLAMGRRIVSGFPRWLRPRTWATSFFWINVCLCV